jgi:RNA polymerase sigma-70 factor (ECF subfamily)
MDEPDPRVIRAAAAGDDQAFTTLMRVHRSLGRFRHEARFSTWLFRIARNAAVDEQRRTARQQRIAEAVVRPGATTDGSLGSELKAALATLSDRLREAFVLVEVFGLRYQDAADVLEVPTGTVKSRVFRARLELVDWFDEGTPREGSARG